MADVSMLLNDSEVSVAVDLIGTGEGVVIGVFVDGVDLTDQFETVEEYVFDDVASIDGSDYWEMEDEEYIAESTSPERGAGFDGSDALVDFQGGGYNAGARVVDSVVAAVVAEASSNSLEISKDDAQQLFQPASSPVTKSRRRIIGGIVRGPSLTELGSDLPARKQQQRRARSVTIIRQKRDGGSGGSGHAPFSLAAAGEAAFNNPAGGEAPWAAPWSPQKNNAGSSPAILFQGGSGQLARALSTSALHSCKEGGPQAMGTVDGLKANFSGAPSSITFTTKMKAKLMPGRQTAGRPESRGMLPSLAPDLHVAMTGSKRGNLAF